MYKNLLVTIFTIFSLVCYQSLSAHNEKNDSRDHKAEREAAEKQQASDTWSDFMKSVKEQETEKNDGSKPGKP